MSLSMLVFGALIVLMEPLGLQCPKSLLLLLERSTHRGSRHGFQQAAWRGRPDQLQPSCYSKSRSDRVYQLTNLVKFELALAILTLNKKCL